MTKSISTIHFKTILMVALYILCYPCLSWNRSNPIFDAHIHYSQDVWHAIPPVNAIKKLKQAGISAALVSSSGENGARKLFNIAPEFIVPALRPYRYRGHQDTWLTDKSVLPFLEKQLSSFKYAAIGEFHINGPDADLPIVRKIVKLAKKHQLILQVHGDADSIKRLFKQHKQAKILWAHAGFASADVVDQYMDHYSSLWADLSFRYDIFSTKLDGRWRQLLIKHHSRFMLGVDTYTPQRWLQLKEVMQWQYRLLDSLPIEVAKRIAYDNAKAVFNIPDKKND